MKHVVARVGEIPPGGRKIVEIGGRSVGVFNVGGEFFALRSRCPHQGGPLCEGPLLDVLESSGPGEYRHTRRGEILRCPWHGWEYDVRTGQSWYDPVKVAVQSYEVSLLPTDALPPDEVDSSGRVKGPYVAETYPVTVEERLVVVDVPA